jgi:hypothetical protein
MVVDHFYGRQVEIVFFRQHYLRFKLCRAPNASSHIAGGIESLYESLVAQVSVAGICQLCGSRGISQFGFRTQSLGGENGIS